MGDNTKISKKLKTLLLSVIVVCFFFISVNSIFAENETGSINSAAVLNNENDSSAVNSESPINEEKNNDSSVPLAESDIKLNTAETGLSVSSDTSSTSSSVWLFVRMIVVLVIVIACIYITVRLLKKSMVGKIKDDDYLKNVSTLVLSPGKAVHVVTLGNNAYVLGVTDNNINLVDKVEDEQLVNAMNLQADSQKAAAGKVKDFASILSSFVGSKKKDKNLENNETVDEPILLHENNFINKQRQRLQGKTEKPEDKR